MCVCVFAHERISLSVTGFMWLISVAAVVWVTIGFKTTVRPLVIAVSSLKPLALSSLYREKERTKEVASLEKCIATHRHRGQPESERIRENEEQNKRREGKGVVGNGLGGERFKTDEEWWQFEKTLRKGRWERGRRGVWIWGAVTLSLICELERTHARTLNGYKRTSIVFNTITLYQEHLKMQLNFSSLLTQKHTRVK